MLQDGAEPSAASITLHNLQRLTHFAEDRHAEYREKAESILRSNSQLLEKAPFALATMDPMFGLMSGKCLGGDSTGLTKQLMLID